MTVMKSTKDTKEVKAITENLKEEYEDLLGKLNLEDFELRRYDSVLMLLDPYEDPSQQSEEAVKAMWSNTLKEGHVNAQKFSTYSFWKKDLIRFYGNGVVVLYDKNADCVYARFNDFKEAAQLLVGWINENDEDNTYQLLEDKVSST
jgi:hypothetical protein